MTPGDLIDDFLNQETPYEAYDYIRYAVEGGGGSWLPLHYFARKAGLNEVGLKAFISEYSTTDNRRKTYINRANRTTRAYKKHGGETGSLLAKIESGIIPVIKTVKDAVVFATAA